MLHTGTDGLEASLDFGFFRELDVSTSPARLILAARLHGGPAPGARPKRVLELLCGRGERLLALAFYDPEGGYLGVDPDPSNIEAARGAAVEIGAKNVRFEVASPEALGFDAGDFDVVLGRDALARASFAGRAEVLRLGRACLSESGILVLEYPVLPGAANRALARTLVLPSVDAAAPPEKRVEQARAAAEGFRGMLGPSEHPYPRLLGMELSRILEAPAEVVWREYLDAPGAAFAHAEVVSLAEAHGLRFVGDAAWNRPEGFVAPEIAEELGKRGLSGTALDQALDVLRCRAERSSIFCRDDAPVVEPPGVEVLDDLWIASPLVSARDGSPSHPRDARTPGVRTSSVTGAESVDLTPGVEEAFVGPSGERIASPDPLLKGALLELRAVWPRALRFGEAVSAAVARLHEAGADGEPSDAQIAGLARDLWELLRRGMIDVLPAEPRFGGRESASLEGASEGGGAPVVKRSALGVVERGSLHALARFEARTGRPLTTPVHTPLSLEKFDAALARHMVPGADEDALVGAMLVEAARGVVAIEIGGSRLTDPLLLEPMVRGLVRRGVATLARWGLVE